MTRKRALTVVNQDHVQRPLFYLYPRKAAMKHWLPILAALALGVVAGSNVCSLALPQRSSAYECRFEFSPADTEGFDRQWDDVALSIRRATTVGKRYDASVLVSKAE